MSRYIALPAGPVTTSSFGYTQIMPPGSWTIYCGTDPIRVHNGYAVFASEQQAEWCAELLNGAFETGKDAAREEIREALGIEAS